MGDEIWGREGLIAEWESDLNSGYEQVANLGSKW